MGGLLDALQGPDPEPAASREVPEEDVREIRRLYAEGNLVQVVIADQFGISQPEVSRIVNRKRRKKVV